MLTVTMTFVDNIYVLATFAHISNILTDTDSILTKLFGPNIFWALTFVEQFFFGPNFFCPKFDLNFLQPDPPRPFFLGR